MSTIWSVILNRKDKLLQAFWTEWRANVVTEGPAQPGDIPMIGPGGVIDPSLLPNGGGLANLVTAEVDFGYPSGLEGDVARTTVAAPWVKANSIIICQSQAATTSDHDPDDAAVENIQVWAENLVPGVGFDVIAVAPQNSWGRYRIQAAGF